MTQLTMITRHGVTKDKVDAYTLISENYQTITVPALQLAEMLKAGKAHVNNMAVEAKGLVSTNGALDKYTFINSVTNQVEGVARAVILNRIEKGGKLVGYTVFTQNGQIREMNVVDATALASKNLISNGKIRHTAEGDIVSSIGGNYPLRAITMDKAPQGEIKVEIMYCAASVSKEGVAKYAGAIISCTSAVVMSKLTDKLVTNNANIRAKVAKISNNKDTVSLAIQRIGANSSYSVISLDDLTAIIGKAKATNVKDNKLIISVIDYGSEDNLESVVTLAGGKVTVNCEGSDKGLKAAKAYAEEINGLYGKYIK